MIIIAEKIRYPNKTTIDAIKELESGNCKQFHTIEDFMIDLNEVVTNCHNPNTD